MRRWEVVARMHVGCMSWIVPASRGRRRHHTYMRAWLDARRLRALDARRLNKPTDAFLKMTWEVHRVHPRHKA